jgi:hypothetical protein
VRGDEARDASLQLYARCFGVQVELAEAAEILEGWQP